MNDLNSINFISNKYLINYLNTFDCENNLYLKKIAPSKDYTYNNYYPIFFNKQVYYNFFKKFNYSYKINFILFTNKFIIGFLEYFLKKKFFFKIINNNQYKINNKYLNHIFYEYKNFQPIYFKKYLVFDFIEILWYSFVLKDLKMLSD